MRPGRIVAVGLAALLWTILVFTAAVLLSSGTEGENVGKFFGTVFSGLAFAPPVWLFLRWYRANEGQSVGNRPQHQQHHQPGSGFTEPDPDKLSG